MEDQLPWLPKENKSGAGDRGTSTKLNTRRDEVLEEEGRKKGRAGWEGEGEEGIGSRVVGRKG